MSRVIPSRASLLFTEVFNQRGEIRREHVGPFEAWQRARLMEPRIVDRVIDRLRECPGAVDPTGVTAYALERAGYDSWRTRLAGGRFDASHNCYREILRSPTGAVFVFEGRAVSTREPIPSSSDPNASPPAGETPAPEGAQYPTRGTA